MFGGFSYHTIFNEVRLEEVFSCTLLHNRDQVLDFIDQVVLQEREHPNVANTGCVVAGNSLGGFTALVMIRTFLCISANTVSYLSTLRHHREPFQQKEH